MRPPTPRRAARSASTPQEAATRLADACNGSMLALQVVSGLLAHGYCGPGDLLRLLADPNLPAAGSASGTASSSDPRNDSGVPNSERECLQRCAAGSVY